MAKRSGKFYRKNEAEVMRSLGLQETVNSGAVWYDKEDGRNDYVLCQLKSTDATSIRVQQKDIHTLVYNSEVSHKLPVFAIQFLNTGEVWLMVKPEQLQDVSNYLDTGVYETDRETFITDEHIETNVKIKREIRSSKSARERFHEEREKQFKKERKAW